MREDGNRTRTQSRVSGTVLVLEDWFSGGKGILVDLILRKAERAEKHSIAKNMGIVREGYLCPQGLGRMRWTATPEYEYRFAEYEYERHEKMSCGQANEAVAKAAAMR